MTIHRPVAGAMIRIFVVDEQEIVRLGITNLTTTARDLEIVGEAGTARHAITRIAATSPDVVVLDVRLPDGNGMDICRIIRSERPRTRCLVFTADDRAYLGAIMAGASGYVLKSVRSDVFVAAIRRIAAGENLLPNVAELPTPGITHTPHDARQEPVLTTRQEQILRLLAEGMTNRQIGEQLTLSEKTIKNNVSVLLAKLGLERRTQAAVYGATHAPVPVDTPQPTRS
ncbi:response regulator [Microbacterium caowuchunii]|uniref:response regulator n=1 Tax=Microbacterium caowuchunii TaxID=2614638 RepID=UPI001EE79B3C|nr:response regulator transcription factor [Microbacterium caowuchunii]